MERRNEKIGLTEQCHEAHQDRGQRGFKELVRRVLPYCLVSRFPAAGGGPAPTTPLPPNSSQASSLYMSQPKSPWEKVVQLEEVYWSRKRKNVHVPKGASRHTLPHCSFLFLTPVLAFFLYKPHRGSGNLALCFEHNFKSSDAPFSHIQSWVPSISSSSPLPASPLSAGLTQNVYSGYRVLAGLNSRSPIH